jgi:hypothetical protein
MAWRNKEKERAYQRRKQKEYRDARRMKGLNTHGKPLLFPSMQQSILAYYSGDRPPQSFDKLDEIALRDPTICAGRGQIDNMRKPR